MSLIILYKSAVLFLSALIFLTLAGLVQSGRRLASRGRHPLVVAAHEKYARALAWLSVLLVLLIEAGVRFKGGSRHDAVFFLHTAAAAFYALTLIGLFLFNGLTSPYHGRLAYANCASFFVLAAIGIPMTLFRF